MIGRAVKLPWAPALAALVLASPCTSAPAAEFTPPGPAAVRAMLGEGAGDGSAPCVRCHPDVAAQWASSAHRFSSLDNPYYSFAFDAFRAERGLSASRFCANCHDPALVAMGAIERPFDDAVRASREARAGIACLVCHGMDDGGDLHGNGGYHVAAAVVASPRTAAHRQQLRLPLLGTARFCATCHKVGLGPEVNGDRWIRGQDDWDAWRMAAVSGNGAPSLRRPAQVKRCQDCHMPWEPAPLGDAAARTHPEVAGFAPGTKLVRSHRFPGANTALPSLRGDGEALEATRAFLAGAVSLHVEPAGGDPRLFDVVLRSQRVGHRFPGGTMDSNEVWIEVDALDGRGRVVARSGALDAAGRLDAGAHLVRTQPVDAQGDPIALRDVQHLRGVAWDTSLNPSDPSAVRYRIPERVARVRARLLYRKLARDYTLAACAAIADPEARRRCTEVPVIEIANDERPVGPPDNVRCGPAPPGAGAGEQQVRRVEHGLALADGLVEHAREAEPLLACGGGSGPGDPGNLQAWLGLARVALAEGRIDDTVRLARGARGVRPDFPAAWLLEARALYQGYRFAEARAPVERLVTLLPDDSTALALATRVRGVLGDPAGALAAADRLAALDPDLDEAHYQRAVALRELGRAADAEAAERDYLRHRVAHEIDLDLRRRYRARHPRRADEDQPLHVHALAPMPLR